MSERSHEISVEQALDLLPKTERIHTQMEASFTLLGAEWDRAEVEQLLQTTDRIFTTTGLAQRMGKGLVCRDAKGRRIFIDAAPYSAPEQKEEE